MNFERGKGENNEDECWQVIQDQKRKGSLCTFIRGISFSSDIFDWVFEVQKERERDIFRDIRGRFHIELCRFVVFHRAGLCGNTDFRKLILQSDENWKMSFKLHTWHELECMLPTFEHQNIKVFVFKWPFMHFFILKKRDWSQLFQWDFHQWKDV